MARNHLHVAVPSYFRCPISLELMQSPVALSTGITYDRSSIQTWLDAGNLTCPATMLPIPSADFVPNLSLHRLIHLWSLSRPSPSPRHRLSLLVNRIVTAASTNAVSFKELSLQLANVVQLARFSEEHRGVLVDSERFVDSIVELMCEFDLDSGEVGFLEVATTALELASRESDGSKERTRKPFFKTDLSCLAPIVRVLGIGNLESKFAAATLLKAMAIDAETKRKIAETQGLVDDLYSLVTSDDNPSIEAGLSTLICLSTTRAFKSELVQLGTVKTLGNILSGSNRTAPVVAKAMEMAEVLATCSAGRSAICDDEKCVGEIVRRLMKVSEKTTEHGVAVLWCVCHLLRSKKAVAAAAASKGLAKCLLVMQSGCSATVRQMCRDLVRVLRVDSAAMGLTSYETRTTHIMPC